MNTRKHHARSWLTLAALSTAACGSAGEDPIPRTEQNVAQNSAAITYIPNESGWDYIKRQSEAAQKMFSVFTKVSSGVGVAEAFLAFVNGPQPSAEELLLRELSTKIDGIAGSLEWQISTSARTTRMGTMIAAVRAGRDALAEGRRLPLDVGHEANSRQMLEQASILDNSLRRYVPKLVRGNKKPAIVETAGGQFIYDWRYGVPDLLSLTAYRLYVLSAVDENWRTSGRFDQQLRDMRAPIQVHYEKVREGVGCSVSDYSEHSYSEPTTTVVTKTYTTCGDAHTGLEVSEIQTCTDTYSPCVRCNDEGCYTQPECTDISNYCTGEAPSQAVSDRVRNKLMSLTPAFALRSMLDTIDFYLSHGKDLTKQWSRIPVLAAPGLCLSLENRATNAGTLIQLANCNVDNAQGWFYDRETWSIRNALSDQCMDVRGGDYAAGTPVIIWPCHGGDAQRWTYSPNTQVLTSGLGNVLEVTSGNLNAGTQLATWYEHGLFPQQFLADQ